MKRAKKTEPISRTIPKKGDTGVVVFPNGKRFTVIVASIESDGACMRVHQVRDGREESYGHRMVCRDGVYRTPVADGVLKLD